jgi:UDP-N-acetylglucosamine 4,6-dehydratase
MVPEDDARSTIELEDRYVIQPSFQWWDSTRYSEGKPCEDNFRYASDTNDKWLTRDQLREMAANVSPE